MNRYRIVETAFGYSAVAFSVEPFKLVEIRLPTSGFDELCRPFDEAYWGIDNNHPKAFEIGSILVQYFNGEKIDIPWPVMDLSRFTSAQQAVYRTVAKIPYGRTASYGQVARMAGLPRAARFVGTTMANNPYPVFIPCHRVIRSDGTSGGFGGGTPLKERMLALEAAS
ncbi:MGMT family protein [uncultured Desulfosarcina sp.]|uniref:methylated-DNA--[protein]-cysteine S-methyltransferase n=1 Tax=uncultured Desulfosarcina sp. TaxID=218289 RepID=UPI0029C62E76|nr:MGMT family protein [uncultured Desulfosarcina sp.]